MGYHFDASADAKNFQKRHYEAIAEALAEQRIRADGTAEADLRQTEIARTATALADLFQRDNPNFNRVRFFLAADCEDQK